MLVHGTLKRGPILVQIDLILIANSSDSRFTSHKLISRRKAVTEGAKTLSTAYTTNRILL